MENKFEHAIKGRQVFILYNFLIIQALVASLSFKSFVALYFKKTN